MVAAGPLNEANVAVELAFRVHSKLFCFCQLFAASELRGSYRSNLKACKDGMMPWDDIMACHLVRHGLSNGIGCSGHGRGHGM